PVQTYCLPHRKLLMVSRSTFNPGLLPQRILRWRAIGTEVPRFPLDQTIPAVSVSAFTCDVLAAAVLLRRHPTIRTPLGSFCYGCQRRTILGRSCRTFKFTPGFWPDIRHNLQLSSIDVAP
ncbi:unnamed protein product, partial [Ectocarpus sp. 12 AP-2014]